MYSRADRAERAEKSKAGQSRASRAELTLRADRRAGQDRAEATSGTVNSPVGATPGTVNSAKWNAIDDSRYR